MYSSVNVGVVHVLGACVQVQSTGWCAFHALLLLLLVLVLAVLAPHLIFAFLWAPKIVTWVVFSRFLIFPEQKNTVNTDVFCASGPKPRYLRCFFASGSKNHGICSVDWPAPSKNTGIYVVFSMLQEELVPCQRRKIHCKLQCFGSSQAPKNSKHPPKSAQNRSCNFTNRFFSRPGPQKTWKHHQSEGFWGRSVASLSVVFEPVCAAAASTPTPL